MGYEARKTAYRVFVYPVRTDVLVDPWPMLLKLIEQAAALWESLAQNHVFINGNKRTALAAAYTFLGINGTRLSAGPEEIDTFATACYEADQFIFNKLVAWLRSHVAPVSSEI